MGRGISKRTKRLTLGAMLSAIGVVVLWLGSLYQVIDLSMAAIASFVCIVAVIELGFSYSWIVYAVVSVLAIILRPEAFAPWVFAAFLGYYPIVKEKIERLHKLPSWILKILGFNVAFSACIAAAYFILLKGNGGIVEFFNVTVMGVTGIEKDAGTLVAIGIYLFVNVVFIVYDIALTRLITMYIYRIRPKIKFLK